MLNKEDETRMCVTAIVVMLILASLSLLCGCNTKRVVSEYIVSHDTLVLHKSDTVRDVVWKTHTDTVTNTEVHTYTLNNVGDTVKEIHHYHNSEKVVIVDSTERYKAVVDSLQRIVDKSKEKEAVKTKIQVPWKWLCFVLAAFVLAIVLVTKDKR